MGNWKKSGGGFLNGVAGTIEGYKFDSKVWEKKGQDPYTTLSVELLIRPDGADAPVQQFLQAGFLHDGEEISDDGLTLEAEGATPVQQGSEFAKFIDSMEAAGYGAEEFTEAEYKNFEAMVGQRFTFEKIVDKEATEKFGKRVVKKGAHKGKEFARDYLAIKEHLGAAEVKGKGGKTSAKASASKSTATKGGKSKANDLDAVATGVILGILADAKNNTIAKGTLSSAIVKYCLANDLNDQREDIRKHLTDEFIAGVEGVDLDAKAKTISLA